VLREKEDVIIFDHDRIRNIDGRRDDAAFPGTCGRLLRRHIVPSQWGGLVSPNTLRCVILSYAQQEAAFHALCTIASLKFSDSTTSEGHYREVASQGETIIPALRRFAIVQA
jgi:hypothetical protein